MAGWTKPVKVGLIGCGWVAEHRHLPALQFLPDAEVAAVADIDPDRLRSVAYRFRIEHSYADFLDLLDDPAIEAVAVCVPAQFHAEVALAGLDAGKHLLIEKPLALSLDECDRLIKRAEQSPSKVMVGFNMRWHRLTRQARGIIQRGALGPLKSIRTVFTSGTRYRASVAEWRKRRELGGGALLEQAVHHFDLWRYILQSEVEEVFATSRSERWDDDTATVAARMADGVLAVSVFSQGTSDSNEAEVYGQAGRLRVSFYRFNGLEFSSTSSFPGSVRARLRGIAHTVRGLPRAALKMRQGGDFGVSYQAEWQHFIDAIRQDRPVDSTLEDGRRALQVALAAMASAAWGRPVRVSQAPRKITPIAPDAPAESLKPWHQGD